MNNMNTGVGDPLSPMNNELLSEDDEKRLNTKGQTVVDGLLWSEAGTGLYLTLAVHNREKAHAATVVLAQVDLAMNKAIVDTKGKTWTLSLNVGEGKPRYMHDTFGTALEIPADLADDSAKRAYVAEWLADTALEALESCQLRVKSESLHHVAVGVSDAAQVVLERVL